MFSKPANQDKPSEESNARRVNAKLEDLHRRLLRVEARVLKPEDGFAPDPATVSTRGEHTLAADVTPPLAATLSSLPRADEAAVDPEPCGPPISLAPDEAWRPSREYAAESATSDPAVDVDVAASSESQPISDALGAKPPVEQAPPLPPLVHAPPNQTPTPSSPKRSLEMLIGMNWMAWAGAASVVLAAGFFVQLAYNQGWFKLLTPTGKCILSATFGGLLLVGGEVARRKIGRTAAASLFGAGISTLYLTAFATFKWFNLVSETGAFWLLLAVALLGFALTIHARMITTGVLATLGGYLTPILLNEAESFPGALLLYLSMLLIVTLGLSAWREKPFRVLRYVALCCHAIVGTLWAQSRGADEWIVGLVFLGLWWVIVNGEALIAALRGQSPRGNAIVSLLTTAWITGVGYWVLDSSQPAGRDWTGVLAVVLAALAAIPAALFGPGVKVLSHLPKRAVEKLTITLWAQTGVLLAAAIGFQFDEFGQTIGWLALGYACVEVGRKLPSRGVDVFGLIVGALALARVALEDSTNTVLRGTCWKFYDIHVTYWGLLALGAVATVYASALRLQVHGSPPRKKLPIVLAGLGTFGWLVVCATQMSDLMQTSGLLAAAFVLLASYHVGRRLRCYFYGSILLWMSVAKWLLDDAGAARLTTPWQPTASMPVFNALFGLALVITAGFAGVAWIRYRRAQTALDTAKPHPLWRWQLPIITAAAFLLVALSFETAHAIGRYELAAKAPVWTPLLLRTLWWALLWAVGGVTLMFVARSWRWAYVGYVGRMITLAAVLLWLSGGTVMPRLRDGATPAAIVMNVQFMVGALLAVCVTVASRMRSRHDDTDSAAELCFRVAPPFGFAIVVAIAMWLGTLEIDRLFAPRIEQNANAALYRLLWSTLVWACGGLSLVIGGIRRRWSAVHHGGWVVLTLAAMNWLVFCTLVPRGAHGITITQVVFNVQFLVGLLIAAIVAAVHRLARSDSSASFLDRKDIKSAVATGGALLVAIGVWLGSLEIDRFFDPDARRVANADMARQTALSIYWGLYAIGMVAFGFMRRIAWTRYVGLGLLTVTLAKVLLVDMSEVESAYRILSFLGVGLLLIVTSLAYAKVSRRLAADEPEPGTT